MTSPVFYTAHAEYDAPGNCREIRVTLPDSDLNVLDQIVRLLFFAGHRAMQEEPSPADTARLINSQPVPASAGW